MANPPPQSSHGVIARTQQWYAPEHEGGDVPFVPVVTVATVAQRVGAQGEQLPAHEQVSTAQTWFAPDAEVSPVPRLGFAPQPPFFADSDPFAYPSTDQTWLGAVVDLVAVKEAPLDASAAQIAAFQSEWSGQQDRATAQTWFQPDTEALGDIPRASAPYDPAPTAGLLQAGDPTEALRNDATWFQTPSDPVDGPLRASRYAFPNGPLTVDPVGSYPYTVLADGAISYWRLSEPFNNQTGQQAAGYYTAYDVATQVAAEFRTAQWVGKPVNVKPGLLTGDTDGAAGFDGASYVYLPAAEAYNPSTSDFTVEAWFKTTTGVVEYIATQGGAAALAGWQFRVESDGRLRFRTIDASGTILEVLGARSANDGLTHHAVGVRDSAGVRVYLDGVRENVISGAALDVTSAESFGIGASSLLTNPFTGDIDEVAVYPTALSSTQVKTHYLTGTQGWAPVIAQPDASEQRANGQTWFTPDLPMETPFPNTSFPSPFDPSTMDFGLDTQSDRSIQPVWFAPDADAHPESPIPTPTTATAAQDAGLWPDQSGQQDRGIQPTWYQEPDDTLAQYPTLPAIPITVPQMAALWQEQPGQERGNGQTWYNAALEPVDGPLQSWLFTTGSPALPGVPPAVLIDAETGDIFLSIGGNLIISATNG